MLCASGFEFKEKLRLASMEREAAKRALDAVSLASQDCTGRFEETSKRYNRRLSELMNHKQACALCRKY
jgi:chemotaxis regulatin CheY-phosphate phosphatase CheZ